MFPLRLAPFEESFLLDDASGQQLDVLARLHLDGRFDRTAMERSFVQTIERHPLAGANIVRARWGRYEWVNDARIKPVLEWQETTDDTADFPPASTVHARDGIPLRVTIREIGGSSSLLFHCHHTRMDGAGLFQFLADLLIGYTQHLPGSPPVELPRLEPNRLRHRARFGLSMWSLLRQLPRLAVGLKGIRQFVSRSPVAFQRLSADGGNVDPQLAGSKTCVIELDESQSSRYLAAAKSRQATLNDLLSRDLILAICDWRGSCSKERTDDWIRLMVPINMRTVDDRMMPAANVVSTVYLDRRPCDCSDPERLLRSLHDEMQLIKENNLGLIFLLSLRCAALIPGGIARLVQNQQRVATAVFTNVMRPVDFWPVPRENGFLIIGNMLLRDLEVYAPLRRNTNMTCAVLTYANRLRLCFRYSQSVPIAEFESFASRMRAQLLSTLNDGTLNDGVD